MHAMFAHSFEMNSFSMYTLVNIILFIEMHNIFSMGWAYLWHERILLTVSTIYGYALHFQVCDCAIYMLLPLQYHFICMDA